MVLTATLQCDIVNIMEDKFSYKCTNQQLFEKSKTDDVIPTQEGIQSEKAGFPSSRE